MAPRQTDLTRIPKRSELQHTEKWSRERLQQYRQTKDPVADAVVEELHRRKGLQNIFDLFGVVKENAELDRSPQGDCFRAFIVESERVPAWVDMDRVNAGSRVQATYSTIMGPALFAGSLVGGAMFHSAAMVTANAGNLASNPTGRTEETAMIIATLAFEGALVPGGEARTALIRVRLLHAALRHWLVATGRYTREDEPPINQHDLSITLALFGYLNLRSLRLMGVRMSRQEIDDYMEMWRFAGFILGIEESLLPESLEDQEEFFLASCVDECKPELIPVQVKLLLDAMAKDASKATYGVFPYYVAQTMLHQLTRFLSGDEFCQGMKIENLGDSHWSLLPAKILGVTHTAMVHYVPLGEPLLRNANVFLIKKGIERRNKLKGIAGQGMKVAPDALAAHKKKAQESTQARL